LDGSSPYGGYYGLLLDPCGETAGSSGGPVFTDVNGGWTIVGVNNRAPAAAANGLGVHMLSWWLDQAFGDFWNDVVQQVRAGA
jgi:hypothetical protein